MVKKEHIVTGDARDLDDEAKAGIEAAGSGQGGVMLAVLEKLGQIAHVHSNPFAQQGTASNLWAELRDICELGVAMFAPTTKGNKPT